MLRVCTQPVAVGKEKRGQDRGYKTQGMDGFEEVRIMLRLWVAGSTIRSHYVLKCIMKKPNS